uniref:Uncharacterized protein n=1 Tax=Setaria digitata TaxID=48799 RepID=A0A915Q212_9BILA
MVTEKVDSEMLTDARKYHHRGTDPLPRVSVGVQTVQMSNIVSSASEGTISEDVLDLLLETLKSNNNEPNILARLNIFHRADSMTLSVMSQYQLAQKEELPLRSITCGPNGRIAFLFANHYHDTWCSHNGVIVFRQRRTTDRLVFSSCPTILRYGPQGLIAVGLITGHISIILNGKIITTKETHTLSVTSLEWLLPLQQLVSASLDGQIIIHSLKSTLLKTKNSKLVTVLNLPRTMRKSNALDKYTGLTSLCVANDRLFVGGETGAIWMATVPDLTLSLFHFEIDCIESVSHITNDTLFVTTSSGKGIIVSGSGTSTHILDLPVHHVFVMNRNLVMCGNYNELYAIQVDDLKLLMKETVEHHAFHVVPDDDALIVVDRQLFVTLYRININR